MFQLLVFGHIVLVFSAVSISYGPLLLLALAIRSGKVETVRGMTAAAGPLTRAIPILTSPVVSSGCSPRSTPASTCWLHGS